MKSSTYLFTCGSAAGWVWRGVHILSNVCCLLFRCVVSSIVLSSVVWSLWDFHFIFRYLPLPWTYQELFALSCSVLLSLLLLGLIACFLLLLKCSFQFHFFPSAVGFCVAFSPVALKMHSFWELNELVPRVHQMFTSSLSWSNCQFLVAPVWEHSAMTYCMAMWQTDLRSWSDLNRREYTHIVSQDFNPSACPPLVNVWFQPEKRTEKKTIWELRVNHWPTLAQCC